MEKRYKPGEFAKLVNRTVGTLRKWDREGRLVAERMSSGHRYYTDKHLTYQQKYGLNSGFSAAMVIARIALGHKERIPKNFSSLLHLPGERIEARSGSWKKLYNLLKKNKVSRHDQFQMSAPT